jgi:ribosome biogenesis GTPase / thiamine phosphate phosphatase
MNLADLGFDGWMEAKRGGLKRPDCRVARITRADRDRYLVRNEEREVQAEATGKLLFTAGSGQDLPCVGDWVLVQYHNEDTLAIIHELLPRRTFLRRKTAGTKADYQMIASNVDTAFIMQSCDLNFNIRRMERYLVMAHEGGVEPVILLSKSDLADTGDLQAMMSEIAEAQFGARVIAFSNTTASGMTTVEAALEKGKTYCLLGSSGVGKTSLLNRLIGRETFETAPVREKDGRGRHTTSRRELTVLDNGALVVDTPGMRELAMMAVGTGIDDSFSDIYELSTRCRFNDCTHTGESGCAILTAVQREELTEERYQSYMKLEKESLFHQMSYLERRKKEKRFGRMVKKAMKHLRKG